MTSHDTEATPTLAASSARKHETRAEFEVRVVSRNEARLKSSIELLSQGSHMTSHDTEAPPTFGRVLLL